jgi:hypothetical protein
MQSFALHANVVYRDKPMRVAGLMRLEDSSGQPLTRYLFSDGSGAPVLVEAADGKYTLLRPFPPAAEPQTAGNTVTIGDERYTLDSTRKLKIVEALGQVPGAAPNAPLLLSGVFQGQTDRLLRELVLGTQRQVYYLLKPLALQDLVSAETFSAAREAERRAAGESDDDERY